MHKVSLLTLLILLNQFFINLEFCRFEWSWMFCSVKSASISALALNRRHFETPLDIQNVTNTQVLWTDRWCFYGQHYLCRRSDELPPFWNGARYRKSFKDCYKYFKSFWFILVKGRSEVDRSCYKKRARPEHEFIIE